MSRKVCRSPALAFSCAPGYNEPVSLVFGLSASLEERSCLRCLHFRDWRGRVLGGLCCWRRSWAGRRCWGIARLRPKRQPTVRPWQNGFGHLHLASGVSYANLTVFPVYAEAPAPARPAPAEYVTLAEGMDRGSVGAREFDDTCVRAQGGQPDPPAGTTIPHYSVTNASQGNEHRGANVLLVTNTAPQPTYVPDGQVVPGGGQDRGAAADTLVPARSAQVGVAAFCVEQHRSDGPSADFRKSVSIAMPSVRYAMQVVGDQNPVWESVHQATQHFGAATPTGTYAALASSRAAQEAVQPYAAALTVPIQAQSPGRVVGVVAAINGRIVCTDLYKNPTLFNQMWPALLRSYALQAAMQPGADKAPLSAAEAGRWLAALDSAPGTPSREAELTQVARVSSPDGAGIRTAAMTEIGGHHLALLHEAFWTPSAVLAN